MSEDRAQRVKFSDTHSSCQSSFACWMLLSAWRVFAFLQQVCLLDLHLRVGFHLQNWQRVHRNLHLVKKVSAVFTCSPVFPILPVWFIRQKHFICLVSHIKPCNPVHKSFYSVFAEQSFKFLNDYKVSMSSCEIYILSPEPKHKRDKFFGFSWTVLSSVWLHITLNNTLNFDLFLIPSEHLWHFIQHFIYSVLVTLFLSWQLSEGFAW